MWATACLLVYNTLPEIWVSQGVKKRNTLPFDVRNPAGNLGVTRSQTGNILPLEMGHPASQKRDCLFWGMHHPASI
jgi:hypothetical protein